VTEKLYTRAVMVCVAALLALDVFLLASSGCGGSQKFPDQAGRVLAVTLAATTASQGAFIAWDKDHQEELVASSATQEEATAKLATYRAKRVAVERAFFVAYHALAAAASALALLEQGGKPDRDPAVLLAEAIRTVLEVKAAVEAVTGPDPAPPAPTPLPVPAEGDPR